MPTGTRSRPHRHAVRPIASGSRAPLPVSVFSIDVIGAPLAKTLAAYAVARSRACRSESRWYRWLRATDGHRVHRPADSSSVPAPTRRDSCWSPLHLSGLLKTIGAVLRRRTTGRADRGRHGCPAIYRSRLAASVTARLADRETRRTTMQAFTRPGPNPGTHGSGIGARFARAQSRRRVRRRGDDTAVHEDGYPAGSIRTYRPRGPGRTRATATAVPAARRRQ